MGGVSVLQEASVVRKMYTRSLQYCGLGEVGVQRDCNTQNVREKRAWWYIIAF